MKKLFPIALIALTTVLGVGCKKESSVNDAPKAQPEIIKQRAVVHNSSLSLSGDPCKCSGCSPQQTPPPKY